MVADEPDVGCGLVVRTVKNVSVMVVAPWPTIVVPAFAVTTLRLSQSLPTPNSHELGLVVGRLIDGSPPPRVPLLVPAAPAPTSVFCAPVKPTTVMCPTAPNR